MGVLAKLTLATIALTSLSSGAQSADLQAFMPTGQWAANGDEGRCTLTRNFARAGIDLALTIEPLPLSSYIILALKGAGSVGPYSQFNSLVSFGSSERPIERDAEAFDTLDKTQHVVRLRVLRADIDNAAAKGILAITATGHLSASIAVPQLAAGLHVLDQCEQRIVDNVGLSPEQIAAIIHNAEPPEELFRISDGYFKVADESDLEDEAIVRYIVGANGEPTDCGLIYKAHDQRLNNGACFYMNNSPKFIPAKGRDGKPVIGLYFDRRRWFRRSTYISRARY